MKTIVMIAAALLSGGAALARDIAAEIKVKGMTCGACAVAVKQALTKTKGVKSAEVSVEKALAAVVYDDGQVTERELRQAIDKAGFESEPPVKQK